MKKGEITHRAILDHAVELASRLGLEGLTIGRLAEDLELSKSGLFAHFQSKEALQVQVLRHAGERFVEEVIRPSLKTARGEPRLRALFTRWLDWARGKSLPGGCLFVAAATELDDKEGPVRDELVRTQRQWVSFLAGALKIAAEEGQVEKDADPEQFAQDLYGIMLAWNHASRLLGDPKADKRAKTAFDNLLASVRRSR